MMTDQRQSSECTEVAKAEIRMLHTRNKGDYLAPFCRGLVYPCEASASVCL